MEADDNLELDESDIEITAMDCQASDYRSVDFQPTESEILDTESNDSEGSFNGLREKVMAFLFVSLKPISIIELSKLVKSSEQDVLEIMDGLVNEIESLKLGLQIKVIGENYQLRTKPEMAKVLQRLITPKMKRLSKAAAETLAVIAYKQPVSKAEIEAIRGVDALPTLKTLIDGRLIRIVGREDSPGSPALYGTTDFFLERFGLKDLSELPTVREVKELEDELSEIDDSELEHEESESSSFLGQENELEAINFNKIENSEPETNTNH